MGQLPEENDIFFGKNDNDVSAAAGAEGSAGAKAAVKSKEELAQEIARNMAKGFDDEDVDISFANDLKPDADDKKSTVKESAASSSKKEKRYDDEYEDKPKKSKSTKKKKKKSHTVDIICGLMALVIIGGVGGLYAYGKKAYDGVFLSGTKINGIDVGGQTKEEALAKLSAQTSFNDKIVITKKDGSTINVDLKELDLKNNIAQAVDQVYDKQDHTFWFKALINPTSYEFDPDSSFNETKLNAIIKKKVIQGQNMIESKNAYIEQNDDDSFTVVKEVVGDTIDQNKLDQIYDYIGEELEKGNYDISIADLDVYEKPSVLAADLQEQCDRLNAISSIELKFNFIYETATLKGSRFLDWLDFEEDGSYTVDEDKVVNYVAELAAK